MAKKIINKEHNEAFREGGATGHNHSYYSLNDAPQSPEEYVRRCKELGFTSVALNDHGTLLGVYPFMDACKKYGINGVPGIEAYSKVCPAVMNRLSKYEPYLSGRTHLIINPKNYKGYQSLCYASKEASANIEKLIKMSYPVMVCEVVERYFKDNANVFATSACVQGAIGYILLTNFRIKRKLQKEEAVCEEFAEPYRKYTVENEILMSLCDKLKEKKKAYTSHAKFLKPAHEAKISMLQTKIKEMEDNGKQDGKKYKRTKESFDAAVAAFNDAKEAVPVIQEEVHALESKRDAQKIIVADLKKGVNKYLNAKKKIDAQFYIPEDELYECAKMQLEYYKSIFKEFFIELQYHGIDTEEYVMPILLQLAEETNTPIIAANDAHVSDNSESSFETRRIIRYNYFNKSQVSDDADRQLYVKSDWELIDALSSVIPEEKAKEAVRNTDIFHECHVVIPENEEHYPSVKDSEENFDRLLHEARQKRIDNGTWNETYEARLNHEVEVIKRMGYVDYHMVVRDFCNEARFLGVIPKEDLIHLSSNFDEVHEYVKEKGYKCGVGAGPGRGSAAGSLVCYLLGITNIDPIKYNLLFERFLNPERVSMPDIDTDIKTSLRPTIIKYVQWKYGERAVCSIATETKYMAKSAVQMAGRERASQLYDMLPKKDAKLKQQQYLYNITDKISKIIPEKPNVTLADCEDDFRKTFSGKEEAIIWEHAKLLEGLVCGTGIHAGGVIISDSDNVNDYVAVSWNEENKIWAAQCDMIKAEEIGLLKMDMLGLLFLDCISDCLHLIKKHRNIEINIDEIPLDDEKVFSEIYSKGNTNSVFQVESSGMKSMMRDFKPTCLEDLIILVACYRPGPMQYLDDIIAVKNGRKQLTYKTPELEDILCTTYGATVYQEQVMQIFQKLAGYSLGAADMVRRAMSKKKEEKLAIERKSFINGDEERGIDGCVANGIDPQIANRLFDEMMDFAKYAFNKSHAASYALVSYQTAWLKYNYPLEYMCSMFNNKNIDSFEPLYSDCNQSGIQVLPPDINRSQYAFTIEGDSIRYGFSGIKGIGEASVDMVKNVIIDGRKDGDYLSFQDFIIRTFTIETNAGGEKKVSFIDKKTVQSMIKAGCFDSVYEYSRQTLIDFTERWPSISADGKSDDEARKCVADAINGIQLPMIQKDIAFNMSCEVEKLGTILSEHPLDKYKNDKDYGCTPLDSLSSGSSVSVFGFVASAELKKSKKGNNMIIVTLQGKCGTGTIFLMNSLYDRYSGNMDELERNVIRVTGTVNDGGTIFANDIRSIQRDEGDYFLELKDIKSTSFMMDLRKKNIGERYIKVKILFHYAWSKNQLVRRQPYVHEFLFSDEEMESVKSEGIQVEKWTGFF